MARAAKLLVAFTLIVLAGVAAHAATAIADERSTDAELQAKLAEIGRAIVKDKCARCHASGADDKSTHANAPPFRDIASLYPSENLAEALAEGIVSGHPDMPVFVFDTQEIEGFIAYLDSLGPPEPQGK